MKLSARNELRGTVTAIDLGTVMATVTITLDDSQQTITAAITKQAVESLELKVGSPACAVIKATEVMVGIDD
ncbi:MAG: TOBE domain-containing protein [Actinomycetaceae bacterium]|nr:TOBE domain-containing protein [Actinomycetaceae bacterium]